MACVVIRQLSFRPPASSRATDVAASSDSRPATAQPPEPAPTTTKSNVSVTDVSPCIVIPGAMRSIEPGISRFRVRFAPRNDRLYDMNRINFSSRAILPP
ncbi:hypothetical protein AB7M73_010719 [Bradyrhizobium japonicum]